MSTGGETTDSNQRLDRLTAPLPATLSGSEKGSHSMPHIQKGNQTVTQITVIESEPERQQEALSLMAERARFMARQPGFVSISLHRSLDGRRIVNYIQWQNR